jgi:metal-responsive CopG/Arc/MetJ family transcriptional regulator
MSVRFNVVLSDDLNNAIDREVASAESTKSEVLRKALQLYLAARDGNRRGLKIGLVEPGTNQMHQEFIGL